MNHAFICDAVRTPFGRYSGALSSVRADDLGAVPLKALIERNRQFVLCPRTEIGSFSIAVEAYDAGGTNVGDPARFGSFSIAADFHLDDSTDSLCQRVDSFRLPLWRNPTPPAGTRSAGPNISA